MALRLQIGGGKTIAQRQQDIQFVASLEGGQFTCSIANQLDQQPQFVGLRIDKMDGNGTTEEGCGGAFDQHFDKLSGKHFRQGLISCELQQTVVRMWMIVGNHMHVYEIFFHTRLI